MGWYDIVYWGFLKAGRPQLRVYKTHLREDPLCCVTGSLLPPPPDLVPVRVPSIYFWQFTLLRTSWSDKGVIPKPSSSKLQGK